MTQTQPSIKDFSSSDGSFIVATSLEGLYDPDPVTEQYKVTASFENVSDGPLIENSFTINYSGCKQEVAVNP